MKTVFILGAGASKEGGAPLMAEFLDAADELLIHFPEKLGDSLPHFQAVYNAKAELQSIHSKSYLDLDNIEILFGAIEMGSMLNRLGKLSSKEISDLFISIKVVIEKTIQEKMKFEVRQNIWAPVPYEQFVTLINTLKANECRNKMDNISLITFNYDLALEVSLGSLSLVLPNQSLNYNYCLTGEATESEIKLLKLHGSLNWSWCGKCGIVVNKDIDFSKGSQMNHSFQKPRVLSGKCPQCQLQLNETPFIVPPTWSKTGYHDNNTYRVWAQAAKELSEAENIFVIGYSVPETDMFFKYLFALGTIGNVPIKRLWVFNPDQEVEKRFHKLIGKGVEKRFRFLPMEFTAAIANIRASFGY